MNRTKFWEHIDEARLEAGATFAGAIAPFTDALTARLRALTVSEITSFYHHFVELDSQAYERTLWGAADLLCGGCGEPRFGGFRSWLIVQGRELFERTLEAPDTLARCEEPPTDIEDFRLDEIAESLYEEATGEPEIPFAVDSPPFDEEPRGEGWSFDDKAEMQARYPMLFGRYGRRPRRHGRAFRAYYA